ncbi:hypothetical protein [Streptomyces subrutilus]|uniref:Uncharacterized protein n=1 Tax=Streptomyces subrutilus TaxID=36818 RepID=A0A1E5NXH6_9ACTN|nr:hypothetical protein [Streptomyces subrutilus]OEJ20939.1 hypothetical protein BGK67_35485 [Streptomyces subrutilus]
MSLRDPDDVLSGWVPLHDPGPAPDLSELDGTDPLVAEWLLSDHPWAELERTRRRQAELQSTIDRAHPHSPPWVQEAEIDMAEPDQAHVKRMRRSLEAQRQLDDVMYVYPPGLIGPMGSLWPPPGYPPHRPGLEAGGWNLDA